jgi:bifunctional non-homologous end joining protein LigD
LKQLKVRAVFDGEIVLLDSKGRSHFQLLQNYQKTKKGEPIYYIFDLLFYEGEDLRSFPIEQRKGLLKEILASHPIEHLRYSDHIVQKGISFFQAAKKKGLEGIIAKERNSLYESRRSDLWAKIKFGLSQEAVICGFTAPQKSRTYFGSLVLGVYQGKELVYVGNVGTGFTQRSLKEIYEILLPLVRVKCPFKTTPKGIHATWVRPKLVCEINFTEWTDEGIMRHPSFKGFRNE